MPAEREQTRTPPTPSVEGAGATAAGPRQGAPGVSRQYLQGASFQDAEASLAPDGGAALKYERSLQPPAAQGGGSRAAAAWARVSEGAQSYRIKGEGETGYLKHDEDAPDGSYKKGDYKRDASGEKQLGRSYGNVTGRGVGWGNRKGDLPQWKDENDHSKGKKEGANHKVSLSDISGIPEPDLKHVKSVAKHEGKGAYGTYWGYDVKAGSASASKHQWEVGPNLGSHDASKQLDPSKLVKLDGPSGYGQVGARADAYVGIKGKTTGKYGEAEAGAKGNVYGYVGASGKYGVNQDGASAEGAVGAGVGLGVSADADAKTAGLKVAGVSDPLTAGVGVHGEASAWAKAGAGGGAYATKRKIGIHGQAGAGAVAEAKADIHGHIGPVSGTYEAGVLAGAGVGVEGGILFEDGKLVIGARAYAALGYGVSTGGKVVIDLKQSFELGAAILRKARDLGVEGARRAYQAADADNDGRLSLNDAATHGSNAMKSGAETLAGGIRQGIKAIDGDGDGKFDLRKDMGAHLDNAGEAIHQAGKDLYKRGQQAVDGVRQAGKQALEAAHKAVDVDGDGKLSFKDASAAYGRMEQRIGEGIEAAGKAMNQAYDDAAKWGRDRMNDAHQAAKAAHKFADRTGDGKLGLDDAALAGRQVYEGGAELYEAGAKRAGELYEAGAKRAGELYESGREAVDRGAKAAHTALDRDGDGTLGVGDALAGAQQAQQAIEAQVQRAGQAIERGYDRAVKAAEGAREAVFTAADVNRDGKIDAADATAAAHQAQAAAERVHQRATAWAARQKQRATQALNAAHKRAHQVAKDAYDAIDRTGDGNLGVDDVVHGAREVRDAAVKQYNATREVVVQRATQAYQSARESMTEAGQTLRNGYNSARETVGGALAEAREFFGTPPW
ncbi:MAG: hypothetical protein CSA66_05310 [Proteobacteria bacterium]|nr:MAG: hypothetical protein CSA66_05310 [Pseudomonadota bacterium]